MSRVLKRLLVLAGVAAAMLVLAVPAFAQTPDPSKNDATGGESDARITGVIQPAPSSPGEASHIITEEGTGSEYGLFSDSGDVDLSQYEGQTATINGIFQPQSFETPGNVLIYVTSVETGEPGTGRPDPDDPPWVDGPQLVGFQGYAADVGAAGMRVDSDRSGEPCTGNRGSLQVTFTADTEFSAFDSNGKLYPITINDIGQGDSVEVAYSLGEDEAIPAICPSFPIEVAAVNLLEDLEAPDPGDAPGKNPAAPAPGNENPGQYDEPGQYDDEGNTGNQYDDGADKTVPPADDGSPNGSLSDSGSPEGDSPDGVLSVLPDTGGLSPVTLGATVLLLLGGGLLTYAAIRQR